MSELTYDPDFPYVTRSTFTGYMSARFNKREAAEGWIGMDDSLEIVDTTPKPKIPEDVEFVYVELKDGPYYVRKRADGSWVDQTSSQFTSTDHLTRFLNGEGDAEVTVLVRKEDA